MDTLMIDIEVKRYRSGFYRLSVEGHEPLINCIKFVCPYMTEGLADEQHPVQSLYVESHEFVEICSLAGILGYQFLIWQA